MKSERCQRRSEELRQNFLRVRPLRDDADIMERYDKPSPQRDATIAANRAEYAKHMRAVEKYERECPD